MFWGPGVIINTRGFCRVWPVSWPITHRFEIPKRFPWLPNPKERLHVCHQQSQFGPILARFLNYFSVLGSQSDFQDCRTLGCAYVSVINNHSFGQFWPVSWNITHRFGVPN